MCGLGTVRRPALFVSAAAGLCVADVDMVQAEDLFCPGRYRPLYLNRVRI